MTTSNFGDYIHATTSEKITTKWLLTDVFYTCKKCVFLFSNVNNYRRKLGANLKIKNYGI